MSPKHESIFDKLREHVFLWILALIGIVFIIAWPLTKWNSAALVVPLREEYVISSADGKIEHSGSGKEYALFSLYRNTDGLVGREVGQREVVTDDMAQVRLFSDSSALIPDTGVALGKEFPSSTRWGGLKLGQSGSTAVMVIGQPRGASPSLSIESKGPTGVLYPDKLGKVYVYTTVEVWGLLLIGIVSGFVSRNFLAHIWELLKRASEATDRPRNHSGH